MNDIMFLEKLILECKLMISLSNCSINCNIFRIRNVSASGSTVAPQEEAPGFKSTSLSVQSMHACMCRFSPGAPAYMRLG